MSFEINLLDLIIVFVLACFSGPELRQWIPLKEELKIGSFNTIGVFIVFMTLEIFFPSPRSNFYLAIGFGLAFGFATNITSYGRKRK